MKQKSSKQAKLERENRAWRQALVEAVARCQNPFCCRKDILSVHEIARGASRQNAYKERLACLVLCWHCNSEAFTDAAVWPIERQVALQCILVDVSPHIVIARINEVRGRGPNAITWADVRPYLALQIGP